MNLYSMYFEFCLASGAIGRVSKQDEKMLFLLSKKLYIYIYYHKIFLTSNKTTFSLPPDFCGNGISCISIINTSPHLNPVKSSNRIFVYFKTLL